MDSGKKLTLWVDEVANGHLVTLLTSSLTIIYRYDR